MARRMRALARNEMKDRALRTIDRHPAIDPRRRPDLRRRFRFAIATLYPRLIIMVTPFGAEDCGCAPGAFGFTARRKPEAPRVCHASQERLNKATAARPPLGGDGARSASEGGAALAMRPQKTINESPHTRIVDSPPSPPYSSPHLRRGLFF